MARISAAVLAAEIFAARSELSSMDSVVGVAPAARFRRARGPQRGGVFPDAGRFAASGRCHPDMALQSVWRESPLRRNFSRRHEHLSGRPSIRTCVTSVGADMGRVRRRRRQNVATRVKLKLA